MDDKFCGEISSGCDDSFTHFAAALSIPDLLAFLKYCLSTSTMDGTIYTAAAEQGGIGRVDNGIHLDFGDITLQKFNHNMFKSL